MKGNTKVLLVALAAGALGAAASFVLSGPDFLYRTEPGQRVLQGVMEASAPPPPAGVRVARHGEPIPALRLPDLQGVQVSIPTDYAGKRLLINLWASWCGPCIKEMPELQRFHAEQGANGTQVVGIALDDEASVQTFLREIPVHYRILLDQPGPADAGVQLGNPKGVLPYSALISADGVLIRQRIGPFRSGELDHWASAE